MAKGVNPSQRCTENDVEDLFRTIEMTVTPPAYPPRIHTKIVDGKVFYWSDGWIHENANEKEY